MNTVFFRLDKKFSRKLCFCNTFLFLQMNWIKFKRKRPKIWEMRPHTIVPFRSFYNVRMRLVVATWMLFDIDISSISFYLISNKLCDINIYFCMPTMLLMMHITRSGIKQQLLYSIISYIYSRIMLWKMYPSVIVDL